jgi:ribokinase
MVVKPYDIITVGSATLDVFVDAKQELRKHAKEKKHIDICYPFGEKLLIDNLDVSVGGGGVNTAVAFSRLGLSAGFIGVLGNDLHGEMLFRELDSENVDFLGNVRDGKSGYSVVLRGKNNRTILTYKGVNNDLSWSNLRTSKLEARWYFLSTMIGKSFITEQKIAEHAKKQGAKIAMNISEYLAQQGLKKISKYLKHADILVLNREEAEILSGKKKFDEMFREIARIIKGIIVISDGKNPVHAFDGKNSYLKKIKDIKVVDTTGAGDAFASGFVYGMIKKRSILSALNFGESDALSVIQQVGATNGLLRKLE